MRPRRVPARRRDLRQLRDRRAPRHRRREPAASPAARAAGRGARRARRSTPSFCWRHSTGASARSRPGWVKSAKISRRCSFSRSGRGALRSTCGRALLDQLVVLDARRAGGHAGHAAEAAVEVDAQLVRRLRAGLVADPHQHDPAARRVHLVLEDRVARARRQAEAAVDAVGDQVGVGRTLRVPGGVGAHMPPTKAPGRKMRAGSKRSLTRAITASAPGSGAAQVSLAQLGRGVEQRAGARGERLARLGDVLGVERQPEEPEAGAADDGARRSGRRPAGRPIRPETLRTQAPRWSDALRVIQSSSSSSTTARSSSPRSSHPRHGRAPPAGRRRRCRSARAAGRRRRASRRRGESASSGCEARSVAAAPSTSGSSLAPMAVAVRGGSGCSRTATRTISPSVP